MLNFLDKVDLESGEVQGCLKPSGATGSIYHAKPVIIQGSWIAAKTNGSIEELQVFKRFGAAMQATLSWWERSPQRDTTTGLHVWVRNRYLDSEVLEIVVTTHAHVCLGTIARSDANRCR